MVQKHLGRTRRVFQRTSRYWRAAHSPAFTNGIRDLAGFPEANADASAFVSDNDERAEIETAPAFHDFSRAIDENHLLGQLLLPFSSLVAFGARATSSRAEAAAGGTLLAV